MASLKGRRLKNEIRKLIIKEGCIDFASNDYLGFARSQELCSRIQHACSSLKQVGATGSRLLTGNSAYCEALEREIAFFHHAETGLLFPTGYLANLGLLSGVLTREDTVLYDQHIHASTRDGITLSHARNHSWKHNNLEALVSLLKRTSGNAFVCVESIYSTDGSCAPLRELSALCEKHGAKIIVDEAHATGVFGKGLVVRYGLEKRVFARVHTFSKALGVQGGIVLGSDSLRRMLINFSRPLIYSTAMPRFLLVAIRCAYRYLQEVNREIFQLHALCKRWNLKTPIYAFKTANARALSLEIEKAGFDVRPLLYPSVPRGEESLRICLHSFNSQEELDALGHYLWK